MVRWISVALGAALATTSVTAAAAVLVVKSSGPSAKAYPAGRSIADSGKISLKRNDVVILLDSRGTRTLRGPGTFDASASSGGSTSALGALAGTSATRRRVGASRGPATGATQGRNVWQADIGRSGNICVVDPKDTGLYRSESDKAESVTIKDSGTGQAVAVEFAAGQRNADWPASMPIKSGAKYVISGGASATLTARTISPVPAGMEGLAQSLIVNGCQAQLDVLIDTFTSPSAS